MLEIKDGSSKNVLKIVAEFIADKAGRPVPDIGIETMTDDAAEKVLEIIKQEIGTKTTTTETTG